jgi:hypothetical protein
MIKRSALSSAKEQAQHSTFSALRDGVLVYFLVARPLRVLCREYMHRR